MSESKHTPRPWWVDSDDSNGQAVVRSDHYEVATCWHHCVMSIEAEMRANALLIAAAPDMLEALKGVLPYMEQSENAGLIGHEGCHWPVELVRAAIAKAEGR